MCVKFWHVLPGPYFCIFVCAIDSHTSLSSHSCVNVCVGYKDSALRERDEAYAFEGEGFGLTDSSGTASQ